MKAKVTTLRSMTLEDWLHELAKRWWLILLSSLVGAGIAAFISIYFTPPIYANTTTILVNEKNRQTPQLSVDEVMVYEKLLGTYKDIIMSKRILYPVAQKYGNGVTIDNIGDFVQATTKANSQIISITVKHTNYRTATDLANLIAEEFKNNLEYIMTINNVSILDKAIAKEAPKPIKPNKTLNTLIGFFFGLGASISIVILLRLMDTRIRSEEDLSDLVHYPLLGSIPKFNKTNRKSFYQE